MFRDVIFMLEKINIQCKCIDTDSLVNLRLGLLTARDTYNDIASKLIEINKTSEDINNLNVQARKFDSLIYELDKIPPC